MDRSHMVQLLFLLTICLDRGIANGTYSGCDTQHDDALNSLGPLSRPDPSMALTHLNLCTVEFSLTAQGLITLVDCHDLICIDNRVFETHFPDDIVRIELERGSITELADNTFESFPNVTHLEFRSISVSQISSELFSPMPKLRVIIIRGLPIQTIKNGTFRNQQSVTFLQMSNCQLTNVEPRAFVGLTSLVLLLLQGNRFTQIPTDALMTANDTLKELALNGNRISMISYGDLACCPQLHLLSISRNPIQQLDTDAFADLEVLSSSTSIRSLMQIGLNVDSNYIIGGPPGIPVSTPPIAINPIPRDCKWIGPNVADLQCNGCAMGFQLADAQDATSPCIFPKFGVSDHWSPSSFYQRAITDVIFGNRVVFPDPGLYPLKETFVGYAKSDYASILFDIEWMAPVDIACGTVATDDTSVDDAVQMNLTQWDELRTHVLFFSDRPRYLRLEVTTGGYFNFDMCDSSYDTSLSVIYGIDPTVPNFVDPDFLGQAAKTYYGFPENAFVPLPWLGGCELGWSVNRTVWLNPGRYTLVVRAAAFFEDNGGTYVIKLGCLGDAGTVDHINSNPGGIAVDRKTGVVSGVSQRLGEYTFRLIATDGGGTKASILDWTFNVTQPRFRVSFPEWNPYDYNSTRNIVSKYQLGELHEIFPPGWAISDFFIDPSNGNYGEIVYILSVSKINASRVQRQIIPPPTSNNHNQTTANTGVEIAMTDVKTGYGVFRATTLGNYTATLSARDASGVSIEVNRWSFSILYVDTDVDTNGPNGLACSPQSVVVDAVLMDDRFSCQCTGGWVGLNCEIGPTETLQSSEGSSASIIIGVTLGIFLFVLMAVVVFTRTQLQRAKHKPIDMDQIQEEVLNRLGLTLQKNIKDHEIGIKITFDNPIDSAAQFVASDGSIKRDELKKCLVRTIEKWVPSISSVSDRCRVIVHENFKSARYRNSLFADTVGKMPKSCSALVVFPIPRDTPDIRIDQLIVSSLQTAMDKEVIHLGPLHLLSVSIALPHFTPREIDRRTLTRIKVLGQGNFGEVSQYQVSEPKLGLPPYFVAAKTIHPGGKAGTDELLEEAALMALLDHQHVVRLVGVVTIPRDLPSLVLLEFCDGGSLQDHLAITGHGGLTTSRQLTYAAQIALGMEYVSSRSIVHRDLAARNVLLDAMGMCKVSDFGMSATLVTSKKMYIRTFDEIAIAWAAPEVLIDNKFSSKSDVWSFGVTVWEIFSAGAEPFANISSSEVAVFVREGGHLQTPEECPAKVFKDFLSPCWSFHPLDRPDFGDLSDKAVLHGAQEDSKAVADRMAKRFNSMKKNKRPNSSRASTVFNINLKAPSMQYLNSVLLAELEAIIGTNELERANSYHVKDHIVLPRTKDIVCSRDGLSGATFVDLLPQRYVGTATSILSYAWQYPFCLICSACIEWCEANKLDSQQQYLWCDILCWNQHGRLPDPVSEWQTRVVAIGHQITVLYPWDKPIYTTRAWCIFELWYSICLGKTCDLSIVLAPQDKAAFHKAVNTQGYSIVDSVLENIRTEQAKASSVSDLAKIKEMIESSSGGYDAVNACVKTRLASWLQSQCGIKIVTDSMLKSPADPISPPLSRNNFTFSLDVVEYSDL